MRRSTILPLVLTLLAVGVVRAADAPPDTRPNILYIMADDHAAHALSCDGSKINQTPNLDRIAAGGMRFTNAFVTNSLCGPSRAALLTGKYSHMNGFRDNAPSTVFDFSQQTFPKLLQAAGYQTAIVGKLHLNGNPTGFDYWDILPGQGVYKNPTFIDKTGKHQNQGYVTDIITDKAIDFMENKRDKSKPFCLLYHHKAPHRSWEPDEKHAKMYEDIDIPVPETFDDDYSHRASPAREQEMQIDKNLTRTDLKQDPPEGLTGEALKKWKYERFIKDYLRCIASIDDNVGRVLDYLDKSGLAANTIVIYTSDNGFFLGDHGWFDKRWMYEESFHVPLLVRYPGHIKPESVCDAFTINEDHAETFLDYAGVAIPPDMQGHSLRPVYEGGGVTPADWRKSVYYHYYEFPQPHHVAPHIGVRTDRYKLINFYGTSEWELFDLTKDPHELFSVYGDNNYTAVQEELKTELQKLRTDLKDNDPLTLPKAAAKPKRNKGANAE